jgi:VCBS repeat-containing protein
MPGKRQCGKRQWRGLSQSRRGSECGSRNSDNTSSATAPPFRRRAFVFEHLEGRQLLSGSPPQAFDDTYAVPIDDPLVVDSPMITFGARLTPPFSTPPHIPAGGSAIIPEQPLMIRFEVYGLVRTSRIGGMIGASDPEARMFGAIVALSDRDDVPDSLDMSTPDVLGHTLIAGTTTTAPASAMLSVELNEGWYALVFGAGQFGGTGTGFASTIDQQQTFSFYGSNGGWSSLPRHAFPFFVDAVGVIGGVLDNDRDAEGDALTATVATPPEHGALVLDPDGTFTYAPEDGFIGVDSFRYTVSDGTSQRTATAWLGRPHAPPIPTNDRYEVTEGQPFTATSVLANDFGQDLEAALLTGPEHGALAFKADGTFVYTADAGRHESDQFLYRVRKGTLWSAPATVTLDIRDANNPPVASDDVYRIEPGETLEAGVGEQLARAIYFTDEGMTSLNRMGLDGELVKRFRSLTFSADSIALDTTNNMVYWSVGAPEYRIYRASLFGGPQHLIVQMPEVEFVHEGHTRRDHPAVRDLAIDIAAGKLYWTTNPVAEVYPGRVSRSNLDGSNIEDLWTSLTGFPHGIDLDLSARQVYWTNYTQILRTEMEAPRTAEVIVDGIGQHNPVNALALDVSRGKVYWAGSQAFSGGNIARANLDGSGHEPFITLDRDAGVTDLAIDPGRGQLYWSDYWFDTINRVNLDRSGREVVLRDGLTNPFGFTLDQVFPQNYIYSVLANDRDADQETLTATLARGPQHGQLTLERDGSFRYVPAAGFSGRDTFSYFAGDEVAQSGLATVTIHVGNPPPVANPDTYQIREDALLDLGPDAGVLANDTDNDRSSLRAVLVDEPSHGTLNLAPDGALVYQPHENFFGEDKFTYRADDGESLSNVATVTIRVVSVNDPPIARPDQAAVRQGQSINFGATGLLVNDSDPEGDRFEIFAVNATPETHGTVSFNNQMVAYTPDPGFSGNASFTYSVRDTNGGEAVGTVHVRVEQIPIEGNTAGNASGLGSLDRARRLFNFNVESRRRGNELAISGQLTFVDFESRLFFRSTQITSFRIEPDGRMASFSGVGMLNGRSGYAFTVHVDDRSAAGRAGDRFRIEITGRGLEYDSLEHAINGGRIDRLGDIRVRPPNNVPRPIAQLRRGLALSGWMYNDRHETLIEQLARSRAAS